MNSELYKEKWRKAAQRNYKKNGVRILEQQKSYRHRNPDKIRTRNTRKFRDNVPPKFRPVIDNILDKERYMLESAGKTKDYSLVSLLGQYTTFQKNSRLLHNYLDNYELPQEQKVDELHRVLQGKYDLTIALAVLVFASGVIMFATLLLMEDKDNWSIFQENDYSNWVTLTVEIGVGIVIAAVIFIITSFQQREIRTILRRQDASSRMKEINALKEILTNLRFYVLILENLQFEIEQTRDKIIFGSDERIFGYKDTIRKIV